ncbi:MAG: TlpA family protein disulfide reductase [Elusimicrobiota bacterium]|jgi:thiol-disulfide isomerase/thioredoxin|nr:TlpA family protein disulfide reductase [Elusimicrobiota bacterium]
MKKLLILTVVCFTLVACGKNNAPLQPDQAEQTPVSSEQDGVQTGQPGLNLQRLNGGTWNFQAHNASQPVLVAFMATFCGYCKRMAPYIDELAAKYKGKADTIIVFIDEEPVAPKEVVKKLGLKNVEVAYNGGEFATMMDLEGFPQMYLFDNKSNEVAVWSGFDPDHVVSISAKIDEFNSRPAQAQKAPQAEAKK